MPARSPAREPCYGAESLGKLAVILDVGFGPEHVGDFFLRAGRDVLVELDLRHGGLARAGDVLPVWLVVGIHGGSFVLWQPAVVALVTGAVAVVVRMLGTRLRLRQAQRSTLPLSPPS